MTRYAIWCASTRAVTRSPPPRASTPNRCTARTPCPEPARDTTPVSASTDANVTSLWTPASLLFAVIVTMAGLQDRDAAHRLLARLRERFTTIALVWADAGYAGRLLVWARNVVHLTVQIVKRTEPGFVVLPRRWVVVRTFARISKHGGLNRSTHHTVARERLRRGWSAGAGDGAVDGRLLDRRSGLRY